VWAKIIGLFLSFASVTVQDVSGSEFFDFTDEQLRADFPQITYGQRKKIMKIVEAHPKFTQSLTFDGIVLDDLVCIGFYWRCVFLC